MSVHLEAEYQRLLDRINDVRNSGQVAPAYIFLSETSTTSKSGVTYRYMRLIAQKCAGGKQKTRSLGRYGSSDHRFWERAIARREAIAELEMQLSMLTALMERQKTNQRVVDKNFSQLENS